MADTAKVRKSAKVVKSRTFKIIVILALFCLAFVLKGERLTIVAIASRLVDFAAEEFADHGLLEKG